MSTENIAKAFPKILSPSKEIKKVDCSRGSGSGRCKMHGRIHGMRRGGRGRWLRERARKLRSQTGLSRVTLDRVSLGKIDSSLKLSPKLISRRSFLIEFTTKEFKTSIIEPRGSERIGLSMPQRLKAA